MAQAPHSAVANGDQKALGSHGGAGQHVDAGLLQVHTGQVDGRKGARHGLDIAVHLGWLAQQHVHGHVHRRLSARVHQLQLALFSGHADHRKRAALALAQRREQVQRLWRNGQHIALLALVAPDFLGRHARLFKLDGAQIKAGTAPGVVCQLRERVAQTAGAHIVNRQNGVAGAGGAAALTQHPALVDDLLRPALNLGVAALHGVKVQRGSIRPRGHGTRRTPAHADAHARPTELDQQAACGKLDLVSLCRINHTQATSNHDGLVVAALLVLERGVTHRLVGHRLLVFAKVTQQIGAAKLVVERRAAQGALDHDLQRAGNVRGLAVTNWVLTPIDGGHRETGQSGFGFGAAPRGTLIPNLAAGARGGTGKRGDGGGVVVGFHLHQDVVDSTLFFIATSTYTFSARGRFG